MNQNNITFCENGPSTTQELSVAETRKRYKIAEEKQPKLKFDEMLPIFQRLPTSELIRFYSASPNPPLGKYWSAALGAVLEKRLPLSLGASHGRQILLDCNKQELAQIKHAELFRLSPLVEFVESAEIALRLRGPADFPEILEVKETIAALSALCELKLRLVDFFSSWFSREFTPAKTKFLQKEEFAKLFPFLLPQLETFACTGVADLSRDVRNQVSELICEMTQLRRLELVPLQLHSLADKCGAGGVLFPNLESLKMREPIGEELMNVIRTHYPGLRELSVNLCGDSLSPYLAAFRALPNLRRLELLDGFGQAGADDEPVTSITDLRVTLEFFRLAFHEAKILAALSKFPNVETFEIVSHYYPVTLLDFLAAACHVMSRVPVLKCTKSVPMRVAMNDLLAFLYDARLRGSVDLSRSFVVRSTDEPRLLAEVYVAMQRNAIDSLSVRGNLEWSHVTDLKSNFSGLVVREWRQRDECASSGWSACANKPAFCARPSNVEINGTKTEGPKKGAKFTVTILCE